MGKCFYEPLTPVGKCFYESLTPMGSLVPLHPDHTNFHNRDSIRTTMKQENTSFVGTAVASENQLPNWLSVPDPEPLRTSKAARALLHVEY